MNDEELALELRKIGLRGREILRRLMRANQSERDEFATALLRTKSESGQVLADLLDIASLNPDLRRRLTRALGEIEAAG
jgi:hypothetical protein